MSDPSPVKIVREKTTIASHIGECYNTYLLVHTCTDPQTPEQVNGLFLPGSNPMLTCLVIDVAKDCTKGIKPGDVVYIPSGDACPALPVNINHGRFMLVQEIYVAYGIAAAKLKDAKVEGVQYKAVEVAPIHKAKPSEALALAEAAERAGRLRR
jgi:hypothetical protein